MSSPTESRIKKEVDLTGEEDEKPMALDEATKAAFEDEPVEPTPLFAEKPFFNVGDPVKYKTDPPNGRPASYKGGIITAVAWMDEYEMHVYKLESVDDEPIDETFRETAITTSKYTINDIVMFPAFGFPTTRTINEVNVKDDGTFVYTIAGSFKIRDLDITKLVARR